MTRPRGGYIGFNRVPAASGVNSAASGIWTLREAESLKREGAWPISAGDDPYFSSVSLLLHMDGANGSTTFTDSSVAPAAITANGNAQISTTQSKFGGASGFFDGSGDYLSSSSSRFSVASNDWTIEAWLFFTNATANAIQIIFANYDSFGSGAIFFGKHSGASGRVAVYISSGSAPVFSEATQPPSNVWTHYALVRNSDSLKLYRDGTATASASVSGSLSSSTQLRVGGNAEVGGSLGFQGYIDDFRFTNGQNGARYTANFTPPTAAFPNS